MRAVEDYIRDHHVRNRYGAAVLAWAVLSTEFIDAPRDLAGQVEAARVWLRRTTSPRRFRVRDRSDFSVAQLVAEVEEVARAGN